jgi:hypothetical protein
MLRDARISGHRRFFVAAHQAAVANIGGEDCH